MMEEVNGTVSFAKDNKGKKRLVITDSELKNSRVPDRQG